MAGSAGGAPPAACCCCKWLIVNPSGSVGLSITIFVVMPSSVLKTWCCWTYSSIIFGVAICNGEGQRRPRRNDQGSVNVQVSTITKSWAADGQPRFLASRFPDPGTSGDQILGAPDGLKGILTACAAG